MKLTVINKGCINVEVYVRWVGGGRTIIAKFSLRSQKNESVNFILHLFLGGGDFYQLFQLLLLQLSRWDRVRSKSFGKMLFFAVLVSKRASFTNFCHLSVVQLIRKEKAYIFHF